MIHIHLERCDGMRVSACGIRYELPSGDESVAKMERGLHHMVDCPVCKEFATPMGTPISELSGQPGEEGFERFSEIAKSCGHE